VWVGQTKGKFDRNVWIQIIRPPGPCRLGSALLPVNGYGWESTVLSPHFNPNLSDIARQVSFSKDTVAPARRGSRQIPEETPWPP
jgi:hypothetical protein